MLKAIIPDITLSSRTRVGGNARQLEVVCNHEGKLNEVNVSAGKVVQDGMNSSEDE